MSVLKANQKPSPFEVEHHAYKIRTVMRTTTTPLILMVFARFLLPV